MIRNTPRLPVILLLGRKWRRKMVTMIMMIRMMVGHRSMGSTIWSSAAWVIITLIKIRAAHLCDKQLIRISPPVWLIKTAQKDDHWQHVLVKSLEDSKITYPSHKWSVAGITGARKGANAERKMFFSSSTSTIPEKGQLGINIKPSSFGYQISFDLFVQVVFRPQYSRVSSMNLESCPASCDNNQSSFCNMFLY